MSVQCCFKSNTYCVLLGDAQQFFCGFRGNIFVYTNLLNQTILCLIPQYKLFYYCNWSVLKKMLGKSLYVTGLVWLLRSLKKKKLYIKKNSPTNFQSCYIRMTFYFDRNVVEWKVQYLSFRCSEVKVIRFQKKIYSSKVQILKKCT